MKLAVHIFILFLLCSVSCKQEKEHTAEKTASTETDSCCVKKESVSEEAISMITEITCPTCGFKKTETMPTEVCQLKYTCTKCNTEMLPKEGDCCVFCTYGTHKCPSKQD